MNYFRTINYTAIFNNLSMVVCGTILLSLGPLFQQHTMSMVSSPSSGIYQSVYKDSLISFPSFMDCLSQTYSFLYFCGSLFLLACFRRSKTSRGGILLLATASFLFTMVVDVYFFITGQKLNWAWIFECFISNLIGGIILGFVYISISYLSNALRNNTSEHSTIVSVLACATPVALAALVLLVQYYILALFFSPVTSYVEARVAAEAVVSYVFNKDVKSKFEADEKPPCDCESPKKKEYPDFGYLTGSFSGDFSFTGQGKKSSMIWHPNPGAKASVTISAYDGCYRSEGGKLPKPESHLISFDSVESLEIELPEGLFTARTPHKRGNLEFSENVLTPTWLKKDKDLTLTRFVPDGQLVDYWVNNEGINLEVVIPLLDVAGKSVATTAPKNIAIIQNGKQTKLNLLSPNSISMANGCTAVPALASGNGDFHAKARTSVITLNIKIIPAKSATELYYDKRNYLSFSDLSGWYSVSGVKQGYAKDLVRAGVIQGLSVFKGISSLRLNGKPVENLESRVFTFYNANIMADIKDDDALVLKGESKLVWVDQKRLSATRWEGMDGATQGVLLGLGGTLLLSLLYLFRKIWNSNPSLQIP